MAATSASTFYVAPGGSDNNPGTLTQPWKTIQKAANMLQPGQTVMIRAGTYHEHVQPKNSGSAGKLITYAAYPGETPVLDGTGVDLPNSLSGLFDISSRSYIQLSGLTIINAGPNTENTAVLVFESAYITIDRVHTSNSASSGILSWDSSNITVTNNRVENANLLRVHECISIGRTITFEVGQNEVTNCQMEGIDVKDGSANGRVHHNHVDNVVRTGIYVDAWTQYTHDITIDNNLIHDGMNQGIELGSEQGGLLANVFVYNNIIHHIRYVGLMISDNQKNETLQNLQVINNTLANNGRDGWGGGIWVDNPGVRGVILRNNIASQNITFQIAVSDTVFAQNVQADHNLVDGNSGKATYGTLGTNYLQGNPLFANALMGDFHILPGSAAIGRGSFNAAPGVDYDGDPRPSSWIDIGADQRAALITQLFIPMVLK